MPFVLDRRELGIAMVATGLVSALPGQAATTNGPIATTRLGRVQGFARNGASVFLGLPYGADTAGPGRFLPPRPPLPWRGVRDATRPGQRAPQPPAPPFKGPIAEYFTGNRASEIEAMAELMGEDCLVLNVVTPALDKRARPVMVYIHGGGFTGGSGLVATLGDKFTVDEDVVLVTVNHRLGALGYMYLGDAAPGKTVANPGMLDLVAALHWVRDNIAAFGGDPNRVTIFGESGGGIKISLLLAMSQAKGLFRAAIIQSGLFPAPLSPPTATAATRNFMREVGVSDLSGLRTLPWRDFVGVGRPGNIPVADGSVLQSTPWAVAPETARDIPLMLGYCKDELTLFSLAKPDLFKLSQPDVTAKLIENFAMQQGDALSVVKAYRGAFPNDNPSDLFFRITADASFGRAMFTLADRKARQSAPVHFYRMELDTRFPPGLRAFHTAELPFTIGLSPRPDTVSLAGLVSKSWAAFARTGRDPNHAGLPRWNAYRGEGSDIMRFDLETRAGADPQAGSRAILYRAIARLPMYNPL